MYVICKEEIQGACSMCSTWPMFTSRYREHHAGFFVNLIIEMSKKNIARPPYRYKRNCVTSGAIVVCAFSKSELGADRLRLETAGLNQDMQPAPASVRAISWQSTGPRIMRQGLAPPCLWSSHCCASQWPGGFCQDNSPQGLVITGWLPYKSSF